LLEKIPFGKTISYKEQATQLGNLKAIRAVGTCNGKNPLSIVVPCHRVLGSNGDLTGYAGGMHNKKWLLEHEQKFTASSVIQQKLFELN
jgi:methylated-DNA-[protein]-cysteine S-methyltransferase